MRFLVSTGLAASFALVTLLRGAVGCGGTSAPPPPAYPPYTAHEAELFDDAVDPRVVGLGYDVARSSPRSDRALFERAQIGDVVVRGRIDSVTVKGAGPGSHLELGIRVSDAWGRGTLPKDESGNLTLKLGPNSSSYGMMRALEERLSGKAMIAFVRAYANEVGELALHFHMVPDDAATAAAVREALSLDRVAPQDGGVVVPPKP